MDETKLFALVTVPEIEFAWGPSRPTIERHIYKTKKLVSRRTDKRGGRVVTFDSVVALWGAPKRSPFEYAGDIEGVR